MKLRILIPLFLMHLSVAATELPQRLIVSGLNTEEQLSQNTVEDILEDELGFIWIATQGGIHLYDGYDLTLFNTSNRAGSGLLDDFAIDLACDPQGRVWAVTLKGIS